MLMSDRRINLSVSDIEPLFRLATSGNHPRVVELLLQDTRVDPSFKNKAIAMAAARAGYVKIVKILLKDKQIDPAGDSQLSLKTAIQYGHVKIVRLLLRHKKVETTSEIIQLADSKLGIGVNRDHDRLMRATLCVQKVLRMRPYFWPFELKDGDAVGSIMRTDRVETNASFVLLLCVMRRFGPRTAARVGEMLREVCVKWTQYLTRVKTKVSMRM